MELVPWQMLLSFLPPIFVKGRGKLAVWIDLARTWLVRGYPGARRFAIQSEHAELR